MRPGWATWVFGDLSEPGASIGELTEKRLDYLMALTWTAIKPLNALEILARHGAD
jgi:hypothetical protein